ncbi:uncharacterized protein LOC127751854 [Frankliniella occidentalis]|uniref:Uncharacterized protein LOC127751854 n=1 Tax=Frankliniella occidentalis TaxID=133901 RepID=A0A9C6XUW8_FRAOC|nr:uncharacterized protein LOC127751854 [Frankliniella occidentalis]
MATTPRVRGLVPVLAPLAALVLCASAARRITDSTYLVLRPKFVRPCEGEPDNAMKSVDVTSEMRGRTTVVFHANMTFTRTADKWHKGYCAVEKCDQTVSAATCKFYRPIETPEICSYMMNPAMPWFKIVDSVQPKLSCPIAKGTYKLSNGTVSMDLVSAASGTLRLEGPIWRGRCHIVNSRGVLQFCIDAATDLFRVRKRPKPS